MFAAGGVLLTWLVQGGVAWAWTSSSSIALLGTGVALIGVVVAIERRAAEPILPGWVWRRRTIAAVNLALGAMGLLMVAPTTFLPTYAQSVLGLSPTAAGFVLSVMTLSWPVSAALSQHVYRRIGFRNTAALGMTAALALLAAFPLLPFPGAVWRPTLLSLLLGAALGLFQLPLIVGVQSTVGWAERGTATASILFYRQIGQTIGAAVFGAVANGVISARLGSGTDLDAVARDPRGGRGAAGDRRGGRLGVRRGGVRGGSGAAGPADPGAAPVPRPGTGNRGGPPTGRDRAGEVIHGTTPPPATLTPDTRQPPPNRLISSSKPSPNSPTCE